MTILSLSVLLVIGLSVAGADQVPCGNTVYDPKDHVCAGGKSCPTDAPCSCSDGLGAAGYGCYSVANKAACTAQSPGVKPVCAGSTNGDPLVRGFDGCAWYLKGKPDTVLNLVSEASHVVNTRLVPANLTDEHHAKGNGTFHGAISVRFQEAIATASVDPQGNLTVKLGEKLMPFGSIWEQSGLTVKVNQHYRYFGQMAEFVTPAMRFIIHAVQPYDDAAGWNRGHLDFSATVTAADLTMHGLLGQSINGAGHLCSDDFDFHGEGVEEDYQMADLNSFDYMYSLFRSQQASRRLAAADPFGYKHATSMLTAASEGAF